MNRNRHILTILLVALAVMTSFDGASQGRIKRITQGIFLYSNWDAPHLTLDTCLDMTITEAKKRRTQVVLQGSTASAMNLAGLEAGVYMVRVAGSANLTQKILVK